MSLRARLILIFIGATVLPLVATWWLTTTLLEQSLSYSSTDQLDRLSKVTEQTGRQLYQHVRDSLKAGAARRPEVFGELPEPGRSTRPSEKIMLERALAQLPENLRDAFMLTAVLGMDHNEVAAALDISPDNARARVSRARTRLRELLESP